MGIQVLRNKAISESLLFHERQYLLGKLSLPQELSYIENSDIAMGLIEFNEFGHDLPHIHSVVSESQYMLDGHAALLNLDTMEETVVSKGDFFHIPANTPHVMKAHAGTKFIFIKSKCINDKKVLDNDLKIGALRDWIQNENF
ncbi:MAG: cupin domain-containing protein [Clostridia bacterium]|nr:cupin domain-containing protein [Clostridia bacterium]